MKKTFFNGMVLLFLLAGAAAALFPVLFLLSGAFMDGKELSECLGPVLLGTDGLAGWHFLPHYITAEPLVELLLDTPGFFVMFWNSCIQVFPVLFGQCFISIPAAWAFARYEFPGKRALFLLYIALMIMPFQVTMVSNYLVLYRLKLMDTHLAVILVNLFSAFPVFIMEKFFRSIPDSLIEAARLDGAGEAGLFFRIGVPLGGNGIAAVLVLGFIEYWNALEQPLTFLKNKTLWPLSLYLPDITEDKAEVAMAASVIMLTPALLLFLWGQDYLEEGIMASGMKE